MRRFALVVLSVVILGGACSDDAAEPDRSAAPTTTAPTADVTMVAINQLHGLFCPEETDACQANDRLSLLWRHIEDAGCPDLVGLTEIGPRQSELVPARLGELCSGQYELVWDPVAQGQEFDQQMILTALPVRDQAYVDLAAFPWGAQWVKVQAGDRTVDFTTTHFASSSNNPPCEPAFCPPICEMGTETGTCHAVQLVDFLRQHGTPGGTWVISGDLNREITSGRLAPILDAGYDDVWTLAGNPECNPDTGVGCTCCIESPTETYDGGGLRDPSLRRSERIDFIFVRVDDSACQAVLDTPEDGDGDGTATGPFANDPADEPINGMLWPADHSGVQADLSIVCT